MMIRSNNINNDNNKIQIKGECLAGREAPMGRKRDENRWKKKSSERICDRVNERIAEWTEWTNERASEPKTIETRTTERERKKRKEKRQHIRIRNCTERTFSRLWVEF